MLRAVWVSAGTCNDEFFCQGIVPALLTATLSRCQILDPVNRMLKPDCFLSCFPISTVRKAVPICSAKEISYWAHYWKCPESESFSKPLEMGFPNVGHDWREEFQKGTNGVLLSVPIGYNRRQLNQLIKPFEPNCCCFFTGNAFFMHD